MAMRGVAWWLIVATGLACGPERAVSGGSGGDTAHDTTTSGAATSTGGDTSAAAADTGPTGCTGLPPSACFDTCDCWAPDANGVPTLCDGELLCDRVELTCARPVDLYPCDGNYLYDEVALDCALTALRDRTPGRIEIDGPDGAATFEGIAVTTEYVRLTDDHRSIQYRVTRDHGEYTVEYPREVELAEQFHFQDCLELEVAAERYDCLFAGLGSTRASVPTCG